MDDAVIDLSPSSSRVVALLSSVSLMFSHRKLSAGLPVATVLPLCTVDSPLLPTNYLLMA